MWVAVQPIGQDPNRVYERARSLWVWGTSVYLALILLFSAQWCVFFCTDGAEYLERGQPKHPASVTALPTQGEGECRHYKHWISAWVPSCRKLKHLLLLVGVIGILEMLDAISTVFDVSWCSLWWHYAAEAAAGWCCCHVKGSEKKDHSKVLAPEWVSQSLGKFSVLTTLMYAGLWSCRSSPFCRGTIALMTQPLFSWFLSLIITAFSSPNALLAISGHCFSFQVHPAFCFSAWGSRDWILLSSYLWRSCYRRKWGYGFGAVLQEDSWAVIWCGSTSFAFGSKNWS